MTAILCNYCLRLYDNEIAPNGKCPHCEEVGDFDDIPEINL